MNRDKLANMREVYHHGVLLKKDVSAHPLDQFKKWMAKAVEQKLFEPNAMSLATVSADGQPSCRTVLLKDIIDGQFVFYTNYESRKGQHLATNDKAALLFWWREHEQQVRIEGSVKKVDKATTEEYFQKRPKGSRIGAMASPQSSVLENREVIDKLYAQEEEKFEDGKTSCPDYWGGYILEPHLFEFWQGRANRLHDRIQYSLEENNTWKMERLAP